MVCPRGRRVNKKTENRVATRWAELANESMGLSTERKVFLGLFLVAGGALVVDQAVLGPKSAGAGIIDSVAELAMDSIAEPAEQAKQEARATAAELLNKRLGEMTDSLSKDQPLGSMFGIPAAIDSAAPESVNDEQAITQDAPAADQVVRLSAVMPSSSGGAAVINGVLIRAGGETADGFRLITVRQRSIILEKDGVEYAVSLPVQGE